MKKEKWIKRTIACGMALSLCLGSMISVHAEQEHIDFWDCLNSLVRRVETSALYAVSKDKVQQINDQLASYIEQYLDENDIDRDRVAISIRSLDGLYSYSLNADEEWTAASLYKVPLAILYYDAVGEGEMTMTDGLYYDYGMYEEGGPVGTWAVPGTTVELQELLDDVILYSDNTAGQILLANMGGWMAYREAIQYMGEEHTQYDDYFTFDNLTTANYMSDVMELIANHVADYPELVENMKNSQPENYLNLNHDYGMIQKYGSIGSVNNASGFTLEGRPYVITVLTVGANGEQIIGDIGEIAWDFSTSLQ